MTDPSASHARLAWPPRSRAVAVWLFVVAAMVFGMVVLGGATRLTGSGLSITEWKPLRGTIPPLDLAQWMAEFRHYQQIPQFRLVNPDMTLAGFKAIYWWEWAHRLLGRLIGLAFAVPLAAFLALKRLPRRLIWRCLVLLALGGLQGLVGWWMVASGLAGRVAVAPERLTVHLGLALILFCALVWTGLEALAGPGEQASTGRWRPAAAGLAALVYLQVLLGGLVAGNHAGKVYTDWPLMNGKTFPADYLGDGSPLHALLHSPAAVQFNHRLVAYVLLIAAATAAGVARRSHLPDEARRLVYLFSGLVLAQAVLGVITLVNVAPLGLSLAHQCLAAVVLAAALVMAWRVRRV